MKSPHDRHYEALPHLPTPAEQVHAEARRRGGHYARHANHYAAIAERWYGRRPLLGEERQMMFDDVFRNG